MAIKLIATYSKKLGLPGFSSHQFSVSMEAEIAKTDDVPGECERLYQLLQTNVDGQVINCGFVPPPTYGMDETPIVPAANGTGNGPAAANGNGNGANANTNGNGSSAQANANGSSAQANSNGARGPLDGQWKCSDKQRELILKLVDEHDLDKHAIEALAVERFGHGVRLLNRLEASGLIDELLQKHAPNHVNGRRRAAPAANGKGGAR